MPTTTDHAIVYPASGDHVRLWEHIQDTAESVDAALTDVEEAVPQVKARGIRSTPTASFTSAETSLFRFDDVPVKAGRGYRIEAQGLLLGPSAATSGVLVRARYTTDGSTPTTASAELGAYRTINGVNTADDPVIGFATSYFPTADQNLSVLWTAARQGGTDNIFVGVQTPAAHFLIVDMGPAPAASGTVL